MINHQEMLFGEMTPDDPDGPNGTPKGNGNGEAGGKGGGSGGDDSHHGWREDGHLRRLIDDNFMQYASYVIRDRAIPHLDDGLKPVQRRIMHSLHENDDGKFIKVANIVGYTMQFHPHGDASIADALVTLVNKRYLIEGQGNFGNVHTGDPAAASRYIECRLTELAREELFNEQLTEFIPSYDGRNKEPVCLPAKLPVLLMLGADGIAVGLSTKVLPHNFPELIKAQIAILEKKRFKVLPDFQQGGLMDVSEYNQGSGRIRLRAVIKQKDRKLYIREIPYGTTTESLMASIEDAARKKKITIRSIHDFTAEHVEIQIDLPSGADIEKTLQSLYAFTQCEVSATSRIMVIRDDKPVEMKVHEVLRHNTAQLVRTLKKELQLERKRLQEEIHRKTLVQIFVENRIYKRIEECETARAVQQAVLDGLNVYRHLLRRDVTLQDVEMLLSIPIKRISLYDMKKNRKEIGDLMAALDDVEDHLSNLIAYVIRYLKRILNKYKDQYPRLTRVETFDNVEVRSLTARDLEMRLDAEKGYVGYDVAGETVFTCTTLDRIVVVNRDGTYRVVPPPEKLFVGEDVVYCAVYDRDKIMTLVFTIGEITYMKRFTFGGVIMNREYLCTTEKGHILLFEDQQPEKIFVKYSRKKGQRIHQQVFSTGDMTVKGVKARGSQMTVKKIRTITTARPRNWKDSTGNPAGAYIDF